MKKTNRILQLIRAVIDAGTIGPIDRLAGVKITIILLVSLALGQITYLIVTVFINPFYGGVAAWIVGVAVFTTLLKSVF